MAGVGRVPKPKNQRRHRVPLARGDWVDLVPIAKPKVPKMPPSESETGWSERSKRAWAAWWKDPAAQMWSGADIDLAEHLLWVHEVWVRKSTTNILTELRQLREQLGLTPKGKQDRRWRVTPPGDVVELDDQREAVGAREELKRRAAAERRS